MRLAILNVKYSPNLGDGLLSECLEAELSAQCGVAGVTSIDLAGRPGYGQSTKNRRLLLSILQFLPHPVRRMLTGFALRRLVSRILAPTCRSAFVDVDAVVLGGGNLLADADLNFPIKIYCALEEAAAALKPVGVFGVGVSDNWSRQGGALFGAALANVCLVHAVVRDTRSQTIWSRNLTSYGVGPAAICRDPGLLTARHFSAAPPREGLPRVGLCITDPLALRYHGGASVGSRLNTWLIELAERLVMLGHDVTLFTNGSPEDRSHLDRLAGAFRARCGSHLEVEPPFSCPGDLARFISSCSVVIAHRMHACIAAYAYAIPHIGLAWDPKLDSFFSSVERSPFMIDPSLVSASEAADLTQQAITTGISPTTHSAVIDQAVSDVRQLHAALVQAIAA